LTPSAPRRRFRNLAALFTTSAAVGIAATLVDWLVLVAAVWGGMSERWAIVPAFLAGVVVQFLGNQRFTFRAHLAASPGAFQRQVLRFILVEIGTLAITVLVYNAFREWAGIDYRIARLLSATVVYLWFSLPMWHWVFAKPTVPDVGPGD
jgi:putative flippase GtrA